MASTRRPRADQAPGARPSLSRGFGYLTLDPAPRLRRLRDQQQAADPQASIRAAWSPVEQGIQAALRPRRTSR
jgi:hypothetical protein